MKGKTLLLAIYSLLAIGFLGTFAGIFTVVQSETRYSQALESSPFFANLFTADAAFNPHGHCFLFEREILWLHIISDLITAFSYFFIPFVLILFVRTRKDFGAPWVFILFGLFTSFCGLTHLVDVWTMFNATYRFEGIIKGITGVISMFTALALIPFFPIVMRIPNPKDLEEANARLENEIAKKQATEEQLRAIIDNIPVFITRYYDDGRLYFVNGEFEESIGYTAEDFREKDLAPHIFSDLDTSEKVKEYMLSAEQGWMDQTLWSRHRRRIETSWANVRLSDGSFIGIGIDITDRKNAERALRRSEERLALAVNGTSDGLWDWEDLSENREWWSNRFYSLVERSEYEIEASHEAIETELAHPLDQEDLIQARERHLRDGSPYNVEFRLNLGDAYKWFQIRGQAVWDTNGRPRRMAGSLTDIDARKCAELALTDLNQQLEQRVEERTRRVIEATQKIKISEERYRALIDATAAVVYSADAHGEFSTEQKSWEDFTGQSQSEHRGLGWIQGFHPEDRELFETCWKRAVAQRDVFSLESRLWSAQHEGYRYVSVRAVPFRGEGSQVNEYIGSIADIDGRKRAERAVREYSNRLRRQVHYLEEFTFVASHDLKEPLRKIQSYGELLQVEHTGQLSDEAKEFIDVMTGAARRMNELVQDLLAYSRISTDAEPPKKVDLNKVLDEVLSDMEISIREKSATINRVGLPEITAREPQMRQLLQNLISNSLKYAKADAPPQISITAETDAGRNFAVRALERDSRRYLHITLRDNGIGFSDKDAERMFRPFQRLQDREAYPGTGIGLAVCRRIVDRHEGVIQAEGSEGKGATFHVYLPLDDTAKDPY